VEFEQTRLDGHGRLAGGGDKFIVAADMVFKAIGQMLIKDDLESDADVLEMRAGRIAVDAQRRTTIPGVWAGGDCVAGGQDLTVVAVEDGKRAAMSIDRQLRTVSKTEARHG
jgi:dihydropyrimidine dehydrogenase (NAD+) subunit PreT